MDLAAQTIHLESEDFPTARLRVRELRGREAISELFQLDLVVYHLEENAPSIASQMLSSNASLVWRRGEGEVHRVRGMISRVSERMDVLADYRAYSIRLVPRAHRLSLVHTSEVFLDMSVPAIIAEKLSRVGLSGDAVLMRLSEGYEKRAYVLQYKESDLAFVSRLAEHVGIAFHFEDGGKDGERIVFTDHRAGWVTRADLRVGATGHGEQAFGVEAASEVVPAAYVVNDYDFDNPRLDLTKSADIEHGYGGGIVEHAPNYVDPEVGARYAQIRAEGVACRRLQYRGGSNLPTLAPGVVTRVIDAPPPTDEQILVVEVEHTAVQAVGELASVRDTSPYQNRWRALRAEAQFRPERRTPRPVVSGLHVGFVTDWMASGPYGAVDKDGHYTVRLHLDTAPHPGVQSLPIRMVQAHAGSSYGVHMPLRAGTEVMVAFLGGDPDRPVIVGSIPNKLTKSPVLEGNRQINKILKTETGIVIEARDLIPPDGGALQQGPES